MPLGGLQGRLRQRQQLQDRQGILGRMLQARQGQQVQRVAGRGRARQQLLNRRLAQR